MISPLAFCCKQYRKTSLKKDGRAYFLLQPKISLKDQIQASCKSYSKNLISIVKYMCNKPICADQHIGLDLNAL